MATKSKTNRGQCHCQRDAFTMPELLVVIMIIVLLASMVLFALAGAQEQARQKRTHAQIARLHELIMERYQSYLTRRIPPPRNVPPASLLNNPRQAALARLSGIRDLVRLELPDRISDVMDDPVFLPNRPTLSHAYLRRSTAQWTAEHQGAECLYLIVSRIQVGNGNGLEFFNEREIGDVDRDGMPEILDAWGTPIRFLRWPAAYRSPIQDGLPANGRDQFDPTGLYPDSYALYPLIISAGPDRVFDLVFDHSTAIRYASVENDPYSAFGGEGQLGMVFDGNNDGEDSSLDNIHNHLLAVY